MIIPIIESIDENKLVPSAEIVYRDCVMLVVKHPEESKYLYLHNKKFGWNILVQGGIEDGENPMVSAIRELIEETGYCDIKKVEKLPFEMDNVFYAAHKNQNRYAKIKIYFVELNSLTQIPHEDAAEVLFGTDENLYDLFGASFRHHYFLLGVAIGRENINNLDTSNPNKLGSVELTNQQVSYRNS
jgi:ADP-ribose pyrophosphatase YjhB (NUDIX family)